MLTVLKSWRMTLTYMKKPHGIYIYYIGGLSSAVQIGQMKHGTTNVLNSL